MRLRYQLRGLGVGIIVTALLMGVVLGDQIPLSDAEIRAKAMELGMVDGNSKTLADVGNTGSPSASTPVPEGELSQSPGTQPEGEPSQSPGTTPEGEPSQSPGTTPDGESSQNQAETPEADSAAETLAGVSEPQEENGIVTVVVESGEGSYAICKKLQEAGLVENAATFDTYLCTIGYSRRIRDGTYRIRIGTSEEEIAKIITKNQ